MPIKSSIVLPQGQMPLLGFGTWNAKEDELEEAVNAALEAGYRHIDTAAAYENEHIIGNVLKKWFDSDKIKRSDLFITTKLPPSGNRPEDVERWLKRSLFLLQLDYVDLYLVHTPFTFEADGDAIITLNENGEVKLDPTTDHVKVWSMMEQQVLEGRTKAIGLSNFNIAQIKRILNVAKVPISNLQIELHVYFQQKELVKFCKSNNISVTAYSSLGTRRFVQYMRKTDSVADLLKDPTVSEIAKKYNKTPAQIVLKHIIQMSIAVIPKSVNPKRIKENAQLFDWELEPQDFKKLINLDKGESARIIDFGMFNGVKNHPEFPF